MKSRINRYISLLLAVVFGLALTACSQLDDTKALDKNGLEKQGLRSYQLQLNVGVPGFDDETTRAVTYEWPDKAALYFRFKTGSSFIPGFVLFDKETGAMTLWTWDGLDVTAAPSNCEIYYFIDDEGQYYSPNVETGCYDLYKNGVLVKHTDISFGIEENTFMNSEIPLGENFACYSTTEATYESGEDTWTVNGILTPKTWRLRFSGTNGTKVTLPTSGNDMKFFTSFVLRNSQFTKTAKELALTVNSGYTPYIYGEFNYNYAANDITLINNSDNSSKFTREFKASNLPAGQSGYFTIPTSSNYSSSGWTYDAPLTVSPSSMTFEASGGSQNLAITCSGSWTATANQSWCTLSKSSGTNNGTLSVRANANSTASNRTATVTIKTSSATKTVSITQKGASIDPNATIQVNDFVTFTDGAAFNFNIGSTVATFAYNVYKKGSIEAVSDDEIANKLYSSEPLQAADAETYNFKATSTSFFSPNTEYYFCAVAKNSSGTRGTVLRYLFKTNSENLPYAEVSNVKAASTTQWRFDVALRNNATKYYLLTSPSESVFTDDWHWIAFYTYRYAAAGSMETYDWTSVIDPLSSGTCNVLTVCTWGVDASNKIGNPNVAYGNVSSSAPVRPRSAKAHPAGECMPKKKLQEMSKHVKVYQIGK